MSDTNTDVYHYEVYFNFLRSVCVFRLMTLIVLFPIDVTAIKMHY